MKRTIPWTDIALSLLLAFAFLSLTVFATDLFVIPLLQGKFKTRVSMPELRGLDSVAAAETLDRSHLALGDVDHVYSPTVPAGRVMLQNPLPGQELKRNRHVRLTLSMGQELIRVPDLRELSPSQASDTLQRLGLRLGETREVLDESMTPGAIIISAPRAGKQVPRNSAVDITISQTSATGQTYVPDFQNVSLEQAKGILASHALRLGPVTSRREPDLVPGTILEQSLKAGSKVDKNTPVGFTVSE